MLEKPPQWKEKLDIDLIHKAMDSPELQALINRAQKEYVYWEKFKHYPLPKGFTAKDAWTFLKFSRRSQMEGTPVKDKNGEPFTLALTKTLYQRLHYIDTYTSGFIKSLSNKPSAAQKSRLIMTNLSEEAIATSQIEGANTSTKVAKEMLRSQRKPRTKSEQMIINSYLLMQKLEDWKDLELSEEMLFDIQRTVTDKTIPVEDQGRYRRDEDEIAVRDPLTGEIAHWPPDERQMKKELKGLIRYANEDEAEENFVHPVVKATILHFWLSYLYPYVDGNGRTARAIFYWYLLKKEYWLIQYISVSSAILLTRKQYDKAFLESELDENDLTYFILYITKSFKKAIERFVISFEKKIHEQEKLRDVHRKARDLNERQLSLLNFFSEHSKESTDVETYKNVHVVSRPTAHNDLRELEELGYITSMIKKGRKKTYLPNLKNIRKLFT